MLCSARVCLGPRRSLPKGFQNDHSASRVGQRVKGYCALKSRGFWNARTGRNRPNGAMGRVERMNWQSRGGFCQGMSGRHRYLYRYWLPGETGPDSTGFFARELSRRRFQRRHGEVRFIRQQAEPLGRRHGQEHGARPKCESNAATPQPASHPTQGLISD